METPPGSARTSILEAAMAIAERVGTENIRIEQVLRDAHASSSSLYHHFGGRSGLISAVHREQQRLAILQEDETIFDQLDAMATPAEFRDFIAAQLRRAVTDPAVRSRRTTRLKVLASDLDRSPTDKAPTEVLGHLTAAVSMFLDRAKDKGLCSPHLDTEAFAVFFMSVSLGALATESLIDRERWLAVATEAVTVPLGRGR